jgi:3-deoxy-7-phosphoheptulonate synthase
MIGEINLTSEIFSKYDLYLQGLHLELTPHSVTECLDKETTVVLHESYTTLCDPRLNFKQSIELVSRVILQQNK